MSDTIYIGIERDHQRPKQFQVVVRSADAETVILASDLSHISAWRLMIPLRKAFLAGAQWFRKDVESYTMSANPRVVCEGHEHL